MVENKWRKIWGVFLVVVFLPFFFVILLKSELLGLIFQRMHSESRKQQADSSGLVIQMDSKSLPSVYVSSKNYSEVGEGRNEFFMKYNA